MTMQVISCPDCREDSKYVTWGPKQWRRCPKCRREHRNALYMLRLLSNVMVWVYLEARYRQLARPAGGKRKSPRARHRIRCELLVQALHDGRLSVNWGPW